MTTIPYESFEQYNTITAASSLSSNYAVIFNGHYPTALSPKVSCVCIFSQMSGPICYFHMIHFESLEEIYLWPPHPTPSDLLPIHQSHIPCPVFPPNLLSTISLLLLINNCLTHLICKSFIFPDIVLYTKIALFILK